MKWLERITLLNRQGNLDKSVQSTTLTICRLAREIFAGKDGKEAIVIKILGNVADKQRKLRTETSPILQLTAMFKFDIFTKYTQCFPGKCYDRHFCWYFSNSCIFYTFYMKFYTDAKQADIHFTTKSWWKWQNYAVSIKTSISLC